MGGPKTLSRVGGPRTPSTLHKDPQTGSAQATEQAGIGRTESREAGRRVGALTETEL